MRSGTARGCSIFGQLRASQSRAVHFSGSLSGMVSSAMSNVINTVSVAVVPVASCFVRVDVGGCDVPVEESPLMKELTINENIPRQLVGT